ncbi:hypothetical protein BLA29_014564 [Euroglyphus maynei]|uniref:Uncharacterized protein n=1 Tax=Euroglyphus maynei TaxID=6958 RepID=A0A1Y3BM25_EURMA|nr:hypothetical protein BLA29_014564 [Euroglyphus maynei]
MFLKYSFNVHRLSLLRREIRLLSGDKKNTNDKQDNVEKTKKSQKSNAIKIKDDRNERLKSLEKNVESFKSISPNDKDTINKKTAKPKVYIRQSARSKEKVEVKDDIEPMEL